MSQSYVLPRRGGRSAMAHAVMLEIDAGREDFAYELTRALVRLCRRYHSEAR